MPFITQGKTNWKFLLIVIILAIIVGGEAFWCSKRTEKSYQPPEIKKQENKGEISVDYPKEGQRFLAGEKVSVCWTPYDVGGSVKLALNITGEISSPTKIFEENIITSEMPYDNFKLPDNLKTKNIYQIFVSSDKDSGFSEPFTIIGEDNWQTYTNEEYGYEFKYPSSVEKDYLIMKSFFNIEVTTSDPGYEACRFTNPGSQIEVAGQKLKINNVDFCTMTGGEHGAGTVAYTRIYVTKKDNKYFKIDASGEGASAGTCLCNCNPYFGSDLFSKMLSTFKFVEKEAVITKTEILARQATELMGQAEKVQLADGTMCFFIRGATFVINGERANYDCSNNEELDTGRWIYGDLITDDIWKANVAIVKLDATKGWIMQSTKLVDIAKVWR